MNLTKSNTVILVMALAILSTTEVVYGCSNGKWSPSVRDNTISPNKLKRCDYSGLSNHKTPEDIYNETEYLLLNNNLLSDDELNITYIADLTFDLKALTLQNNRLTKVPDLQGLFQTLLYLSLQGNLIQSLDLNYFANFVSLSKLHLGYNRMNDSSLKYLTSPLPSLKYLYVPQNNLAEINLNRYAMGLNNTVLTELQVGGQEVKRIVSPVSPVINTDKVNMIDFDWPIEAINFAETVNAKRLNMVRARISEFHYDAFVGSKHIEIVHFSETNIGRMISLTNGNSVIESIKTLEFIKTTWNDSCLNISDFSWDKMPNLRTLVMNSIPNSGPGELDFCLENNETATNLITSISFSGTPFNGCYNLNYTLKYFPNIQVLNLDNRGLSCFSNDQVAVNNIWRVYMKHNKFTHLNLEELSKIFPVLQYLDIQYNLLTKVTGQYPSVLKSITLSRNPSLESIEPMCQSWGLELILHSTGIQCNACLIWLKACPYNIKLHGSCAGPKSLAGKSLDEVTALNLAEVECKDQQGEANNGKWFKIAPDPTQSVVSGSGSTSVDPLTILDTSESRCARLTSVIGYPSFDYSKTTGKCQIHISDTGRYKLKTLN